MKKVLIVDDSEVIRQQLSRALNEAGLQTVEASDGVWSVLGGGGRLEGGVTLDVGASGTTLRLLAGVASLGRRPSRLGGVSRLAERPLDPLLAALRALGAHAERLPVEPGQPP